MSRRELLKKIEELRKAGEVGEAARKEEERTSRVIAYLDALLEKRRQGPDEKGSPIERTRARGDTEAIAEYERLKALIEERRTTGGR
jgi:hypothetical protein